MRWTDKILAFGMLNFAYCIGHKKNKKLNPYILKPKFLKNLVISIGPTNVGVN